MKHYKNFSYNRVATWRVIPLHQFVRAANACHRGSNYTGCSKTEILSRFDERFYNGSTEADPNKLIVALERIAYISKDCSDELYRRVGNALKDL